MAIWHDDGRRRLQPGNNFSGLSTFKGLSHAGAQAIAQAIANAIANGFAITARPFEIRSVTT
jgi:hypothetical protein